MAQLNDIKNLSESEFRGRFFAKVDQTTSPHGCWLWLGARNGLYGEVSILRNRKRYRFLAHRISWELANGPIPDGLLVCHNCPGGDNPRCVNPAHLFLGTIADNNRDMVAKGRLWTPLKPGEHHPSAVLTQYDVDQIRDCYASGSVSTTDIAKRFRISRSHAWQVVARKVWKES